MKEINSLEISYLNEIYNLNDNFKYNDLLLLFENKKRFLKYNGSIIRTYNPFDFNILLIFTLDYYSDLPINSSLSLALR